MVGLFGDALFHVRTCNLEVFMPIVVLVFIL